MNTVTLMHLRAAIPEALTSLLTWLADRVTCTLRFGGVYRDSLADTCGRVVPATDFAFLTWVAASARQEVLDDREGRLALESLEALLSGVEIFPARLELPSPSWLKIAYQWLLLSAYAGLSLKDSAKGDYAPPAELDLERVRLWEDYRRILLESAVLLSRAMSVAIGSPANP